MEAGARDFASTYLVKQLDRVAFQVSTAIARRDTEAIHDLRVAMRRFAQGLVVFRPHVGSRKPKKIRRALKQVMELAGAVRDYDVALGFVSKMGSPYAARLRKALGVERKNAERELIESLKHWVARKTSRKWREELEGAHFTRIPDELTPAEIAGGELPRMATAFLAWGERAARTKSSAEELHQFRLAAKKFRYTLEIFAVLYQQSIEMWLPLLKKVQQLLGRINDCSSFRRLLSRLGRHPKLEAQLKLKERRRTAEFRRFWTREVSESAEIQQRVELLRQPADSSRPLKRPAGRSLSSRGELVLVAHA